MYATPRSTTSPSSRPKLGGTPLGGASPDSMALKNICTIPRHWTLADYRRHTCSDGSHQHISRAQLHQIENEGRIVWLLVPKDRRDQAVVYVLETHPGPSTRSWLPCAPINTGLSNRVGEVLAIAVYRNKPWARVMLAHMNPRRPGHTTNKQEEGSIV